MDRDITDSYIMKKDQCTNMGIVAAIFFVFFRRLLIRGIALLVLVATPFVDYCILSPQGKPVIWCCIIAG